jgi:hypothetical protein
MLTTRICKGLCRGVDFAMRQPARSLTLNATQKGETRVPADADIEGFAQNLCLVEEVHATGRHSLVQASCQDLT